MVLERKLLFHFNNLNGISFSSELWLSWEDERVATNLNALEIQARSRRGRAARAMPRPSDGVTCTEFMCGRAERQDAWLCNYSILLSLARCAISLKSRHSLVLEC